MAPAQTMLTIGRLARESGLSISALRFYDTAGVFAPAWVDPDTGYRWYRADQVADARLIARLRRVRMPLREIAVVLERQGDARVVGAVLDTHLRRLEDGLADARRQLDAVHTLVTGQVPGPSACRITMIGRDLAGALRAVRYAAGTVATTPMLGGVLFDGVCDAAAGALTLVASDRYRLATATAPTIRLTGTSQRVVAALDLVDELIAILAVEDGSVELTLDRQTITLRASDRRWHAPAAAHEFPDYRKLLPAAGAVAPAIEVAALRAAVTDAPTRTMRRVQDGTDHAVVVLHGGRYGTVGVEPASANDIAIGVNREFLLQALDSPKATRLTVELDGPMAPLAFRATDRYNVLSLIMPTRLVAS